MIAFPTSSFNMAVTNNIFSLLLGVAYCSEYGSGILEFDFCVILDELQANLTSVVTTCNQYRTYDDMTDNWESLQNIFQHFTNSNPSLYNFSLPGSFNDPDEVTDSPCQILVNRGF